MYSGNNIKISVNPSNLVSPVRVNEKILKVNNNISKIPVTNFIYKEYNYRSDKSINDFYRSIDRINKQYKLKYIFESDNTYEEKPIINNLLPRIFYRIHTKPDY